jgi:hypothetical protein
VTISTSGSCAGTAGSHAFEQCYGGQGAHIYLLASETNVRYHLQIWNGVSWVDVGNWKIPSPPACVDFGIVNVDGLYKVIAQLVTPPGGPFTDMSNTVTLVTDPMFVAGIATNPNPTICYNDEADLPLTASSASGGGNPISRQYTWQVSSDNLNYVDIPGTTTTAPADYLIPYALIQTTYFRVREVDLTCSVQRYTAPVPVYVYDEYFAGLAYNMFSDPPTIEEFGCPGQTFFDITAEEPDGGSDNNSYQWQYYQDDTPPTTWTDIPGANSLDYYLPGPLFESTHYRCIQTDTYCEDVVVTNVVNKIVYVPAESEICCDQELCYGFEADFLHAANPTGGSGVYEYSWQMSTDDGLTWSDIPLADELDYSPGVLYQTTEYRLQIHDLICFNLFGYTNDVEITVAGQMNAYFNYSLSVTCNGVCDGYIYFFDPIGGFDGYEFSIDGGLTWSSDMDYYGLCPGTYELWMRDASRPECMVGGRLITIDEPEALDADFDFTHVTCSYECDGTITFSDPEGGFGEYEFSIDGGLTWSESMNYTGLCTDDYSLWIRDEENPDCMVWLGDIFIPAPAPLNGYITYTNVTCNDLCDGTIFFHDITGGWDGYEYSIDFVNWQTDPSFTGLCGGDYLAYVRDAENTNCWAWGEVLIGVPDELDAEVTYTHVTCAGVCDGTITITDPEGGWDGFEFSIDGGLTWTSDMFFSGLCAGEYDVYMRDALYPDCEVELMDIEIPAPGYLDAYFTYQDATCFGTCDGSFYFYSPVGGWDGYEFSVDGGLNWTSETLFTGLCAGDYFLMMRDAENPDCTVGRPWTLYGPEELEADVDYTNMTCYATCDGTITITNAEGGWDGYEFSIDGGFSWSATTYYTGLCDGEYEVWMRDAANPTCMVDLATIDIESPEPLFSFFTPVNITCFNTCDGSITFYGTTGGWDGYDYTIDGGTTWQTSPEFTGLCPGEYIPGIRDALNPNCTAWGYTYLYGPDELDADFEISNVTCFGSCDGEISFFDAEGGWDGYEFSIDGGFTWSSDMTFTGLCSDIYSLYIRDAANPDCFVWLDDVYIPEPEPLGAWVSWTAMTCYEVCDGTITFSDVTGGWDGYEYSIDGGLTWSSSSTYTGLCSGYYEVWVRDAENPACMIGGLVIFIDEPEELEADVEVTNVTCYGSCDGTITITDPEGGWDGYEFLVQRLAYNAIEWSTETFYTGLCPGIYDVWMRDAANPNCVKFLGEYTILQPDPLFSFFTPVDITCSDVCDGSFTFYGTTGGWDGYEFTIDGGLTWQTSPEFTGLCPGEYILGLRDAENPDCNVWGEWILYGPEPLNAEVSSTNMTCYGICDGTITITDPSGGWDGYEFSIDDGLTWSTDMIYTGLCEGEYEVYMRDAEFPTCIKELGEFSVLEPDPLFSWFAPVDITCYRACDGSITFYDYSGGWDGYEFTVDGGFTWQTSPVFTGLCPGEYIPGIRDASNPNCTAWGYWILYEPDPLDADVSTTNTCENKCDGKITITDAEGGWDGYEFSIDGGFSWSSETEFTGLCAGFYDVWMRDALNPNCVVWLGYYYIYAVPAPHFHIEGPNPVCQYESGDVYCVVWDSDPIFEVTYQWVVTDNGSGLTTFTGNNSPCIVVNWGNGTAGQVSCLITYTNEYLEWDVNCSACVIMPITINPLPDPHIVGCEEVTVGDICCYEVAYLPGYLYNWTVNCGEILDCGCGYRTCVHWLTAGTCTISVCVTNIATGCSSCTSFIVIVHPGEKTLDGYITYNNIYETPLNDITVQLKDLSGAVVATTLSGVNTETWTPGYYAFDDIAPGFYQLNAFHAGNWAGVNATDALIDQLVFLGLYTFNHFDSIVGNVNADTHINPTDALWIKMRSINLVNYFPAGDWKFNIAPYVEVLSTQDVTQYDFKGACVGDVNYSNIPTGFKAASTIGIINDGVVNILPNESFTYTVRLSKAVELGAMTLLLNYDQNLVDVEEVVSSPEGTKYLLNNGTLNLAWSDTKSLSLTENDAILVLRLKSKVDNAQATQLFTVNAGSEFADPGAGIISNLDLKMGSISTLTGNDSFSLSNYPNPFRNSTTISYSLPEQGHVTLVLTNMYGETLKTLVNADQIAGTHQILVNPADLNLSSGVYLYKIEINGVSTFWSKTNKMMLTR